jgi:hypothetical protein
MQARTIVLASVFLSFCLRLAFVSVMFLSAGEVQSSWLMWALLIIMSVALTRTLYRTYNVLKVILAVGKLD